MLLGRDGFSLTLRDMQPENLEASGLVSVLNTSVFAIVGAISLQQGAEVASKVVREKILKRLEA